MMVETKPAPIILVLVNKVTSILNFLAHGVPKFLTIININSGTLMVQNLSLEVTLFRG